MIFADDVLLYRTIRSPDDECIFQAELQLLHAWSVQNIMSFNPSKCKILHVTRSRNMQFPVYKLNNSCISAISSYKYLGITISSNLQWKSHVESVVMKANRLLGFIRVVAGKASTTAIFSLYKSLVLPILE